MQERVDLGVDAVAERNDKVVVKWRKLLAIYASGKMPQE